MTTEEQTRRRKALIISSWLHYFRAKIGKPIVEGIEVLVYTLVASDVSLLCKGWTLLDCYYIAELSGIDLPIDDLALAILKGLQTKIETSEELGLRKCSMCKREKSIEEFHVNSKYCKKCKSFYDYVLKGSRVAVNK